MLLIPVTLTIILVLALAPLALEKPYRSGELDDMGIRLERL